ncbi:MAG: hypothetical protein DI538_11095 [Azospira oryzae]|jgi:DNA-directed RNA polymerase specialized sigma24 family protein|nr:MAG: hypothetical protein DI538_11095 [Azospira oryzae]
MNTFVEERFMKELNEHAGIVRRICRIYFPDTDDRKDVFQEIVFQLWKSYPSKFDLHFDRLSPCEFSKFD